MKFIAQECTKSWCGRKAWAPFLHTRSNKAVTAISLHCSSATSRLLSPAALRGGLRLAKRAVHQQHPSPLSISHRFLGSAAGPACATPFHWGTGLRNGKAECWTNVHLRDKKKPLLPSVLNRTCLVSSWSSFPVEVKVVQCCSTGLSVYSPAFPDNIGSQRLISMKSGRRYVIPEALDSCKLHRNRGSSKRKNVPVKRKAIVSSTLAWRSHELVTDNADLHESRSSSSTARETCCVSLTTLLILLNSTCIPASGQWFLIGCFCFRFAASVHWSHNPLPQQELSFEWCMCCVFTVLISALRGAT